MVLVPITFVSLTFNTASINLPLKFVVQQLEDMAFIRSSYWMFVKSGSVHLKTLSQLTNQSMSVAILCQNINFC